MQAADFHLLHNPNTTIDIFSPTFINEPTAEQLKHITKEDILTKKKHTKLTQEIQNLKQAKKLLAMV